MKKILMILDKAYKPDLRVKKEIETITQMGFYIDLICWDQDSDLSKYEELKLFTIHRLKLKVGRQIGIKKIVFLYKFFKMLKNYVKNLDHNYDFVYVHDFLMLPIGVYFKKKLKSKLIYDAHEIYHLMEWEKYPNIVSKLIYALERHLIKKTDVFIVVSDYRKDFYAEKLDLKINVIGNWYDDYNDNSLDIRKELNIDPSKKILAYFGVINFNARPINKLFEYVHQSNDLHFVIGGVGVDKDRMNDIANSSNNISYLGWVNNVREYIDTIDYLVYFMNNKRKYFYYSAPNALYLAISHRKPLITNVAGEPKDIIAKNNVGIYLNNIDDFKEIKINDEVLYNTMVLNIEKVKKNYSWSKSIDVYKQILFSE